MFTVASITVVISDYILNINSGSTYGQIFDCFLRNTITLETTHTVIENIPVFFSFFIPLVIMLPPSRVNGPFVVRFSYRRDHLCTLELIDGC